MKRLFGFLAVAGLMTFAAPVVPAQAVLADQSGYRGADKNLVR